MTEFFIYYRENCVWCDKAKRLIESHGDIWNGLDIRRHPENRAKLMLYFPDATTVPQICYIDDGYVQIGGYSDLEKWYER